MKIYILIPVLICIIVAGCSNKTGKIKNDNQIDLNSINSKSKSDKKIKTVKKHLLRQTVNVTAIGNTEKNDKVKITFTIDPLNRIKGKLIVNSMTFDISGIFLKNQIRCWLTENEKLSDNVWRGMITGRQESNIYKGTITISDNGAEHIITANWVSN